MSLSDETSAPKTGGGTLGFWVRTVVSLSVRGSPSCKPQTTMTDPIVRCDDCHSLVELIRKNNNTLALRCDCPQLVHVRVDRVIPREWTDD